jgi:hypothetical protein
MKRMEPVAEEQLQVVSMQQLEHRERYYRQLEALPLINMATPVRSILLFRLVFR